MAFVGRGSYVLITRVSNLKAFAVWSKESEGGECGLFVDVVAWDELLSFANLP
jgi:hypothetical protein